MSVDNITLERMNSSIDLGPTSSIQLLFAKLQLAMAEQSKTKAMSYMDAITTAQDESKKVADMIQKCRGLQNDAKVNGSSIMPADVKTFMKDHQLPYDTKGNDDKHNKDEWEVAITSLRNYQEQIGSDTQQKMVFIQDFMGQYNSYLQGANSAIQQSNQTLSAIARGQ